MALTLCSTTLWALTLWTVYQWISSATRKNELRRFARENGATLPRFSRGFTTYYFSMTKQIKNAVFGPVDLLDIVQQSFDQYGATFSSGHRIITMDPQNVQTIMATNVADFELGAFRNAQFSLLMGKSIFTVDGQMWEHSRALLRPAFTRQNINNLFQTEKSVQDLFYALSVISKQEGAAVEVDMLPLLFRFTIDTATEFLFGESLGSQIAAAGPSSGSERSSAKTLAADLSESSMSFSEAFHAAQDWIANRIILSSIPWVVPSGRGRRGVSIVRDYTKHYVKLVLGSSKATGNPRPSYNLLRALSEYTKDERELCDEVVAVLFAGRNTTASLLGWVLCFLSRNSHIFAKLRTIIQSEFGSYTETPTNINFETLKGCYYLQYVLRETLRLAPVVPVNTRTAVRDTTLPRGGGPDGKGPMAIGKGQMVLLFSFALHRQKDLWGPDADDFKPERWEGRKIDWSFVPFGGGPRTCLGQQFALTEAGYLIVRLLQKYEKIDWLGSHGEPQRYLHLTMSPKGGVPLRLIPSQP